jgi:hypothetical protein
MFHVDFVAPRLAAFEQIAAFVGVVPRRDSNLL